MAVASPFGAFIDAAEAGALHVRLEPEVFLDLDRACRELVDALTTAQHDARALGELGGWGLGEDNPRLWSAIELVELFREKAFGGPGSAYDTLGEYIAVVGEIQALFGVIRQTFERTDAEFAARIRELTG
ncbi:hypothetical protein [Nocardia bhagyanarayanae]|uniref:PE family protein n=1 Tax=Nocardia bhagyanarayanae TaxID=1215925 RepID=A0A543FE58_9NOCA|nr:hypothetical protein [Nocardia bhagyanarayanae]TQM32158.1 hypothetical protein FB390_3836 [Nocardia bhagyanarayanae]